MKIPILVLLCMALFASCRKDSFITSPDASLATSADTLSFDTVFTSAGSITGSFKIFNNNDQKLNLSSVKLAGGASSPFEMNVDGTAATEVKNLAIERNDSIYVFVQVNINPTSALLPFVLRDSIGITFNGNTRWVQLQAYGRNAIFLKNQVISQNTAWDDRLPYVILGGLRVDSSATLSFGPGTMVFMHADAPFLVDGTIRSAGTAEAPVVFTGDRLDPDYKDLPAGWPGIYFRNVSENNSLTHTTIKNAYQGLVLTGLPQGTAPKLTVSKCRLENIYDAGILAVNSSIDADNCLISNCGSNLDLQGGNYRFVHCTIASYGTAYIAHSNPVLQLYNYFTDNGPGQTFDTNAWFENCVFWGDNGTVDNELAIDRQGSSVFSVTFDHDLYKAKNTVPGATFVSCIVNETPLFDSIDPARDIFDFHFAHHPESPAVNAGAVTLFTTDLDDRPRDTKPDIGCYER